jgi:hypothetical protein
VPSSPTTSEPLETWNDASQICEAVRQQHLHLSGMKQSQARYTVLKEISIMEDYGLEKFNVKSLSPGNEELLRLGVGPKGVSILREDNGLREESNPLAHRKTR